MNLSLFNRDVLATQPALLNELDQLIARINLVFGREHDPQTGAHTDLTVESLTWTGEVDLAAGVAGLASALPATPSGYLPFTIGTRTYVLPFYEAS